MQTTKFLFVLGAVAILAIPSEVTAAPDTEAQARMREAMRQKMQELNAPATPAPAPVATPPKAATTVAPKPTPAPAPRPVKTPTIVVPIPVEASAPAPAVTAPVVDANAERLREAMRQRMEALNAPQTPATSVIAPVAAVPVAPQAAPKSEGTFSEVPGATETAETARLREAMRVKLATTPTPPAAQPAATAKATASVVAPAPLADLPAPASPFAGSKQQQLAELLSRYKADIITPQEYHLQRAKIIAAP